VKKYLEFGIICGIVGSLSLSCAPSIHSAPPIKIEGTSIARSISNPQPTLQGQKLPVTAQVSIHGETIKLEVARTAQEQSIGLMHRQDLAKDRGMLFVFSPPRPVSFWMKNTLIPLDMIFVSNGVVKHIGVQIPPCKQDPCPGYGPEPNTNIDGVIELRGGRATELDLQVGDRLRIVSHSAKRLKKS
jgi:uncharacterized protein